MGIPTYFRYLFETYGSEIVSMSVNQQSYDGLFFDFNSIIYNVYYKKVEENQIPQQFFENIYKELFHICFLVNPKQTIYLFLDGPVPRAKMVQQRSRRYKSIQLQELLGKASNSFNPSNNICPGTIFMQDMTKFLKSKFPELQQKLPHHPEILFSDSNTFGEGEHKMMPVIRSLAPDFSLCVMSPDNDLLSLLILTEKKFITLFRKMDVFLKRMLRIHDDNQENFIFIAMDRICEKFTLEQSKQLNTSIANLNEKNLLLDYNMLLSMVGNDFVPVLPYMRIKNGGMNTLMYQYNKIFKETGKYLIHPENLSMNQEFFKKLLLELSKREFTELKKLGSFLHMEKTKQRDHSMSSPPKTGDEKKKQQQQKLEDRINHLYLCNPESPLYETYQEDFNRLTFQEKTHWEMKQKYYHYFGIFREQDKRTMIQEYLKALKFTLLYYNKECPSNVWFYPYRCAPMMSDVYQFVCKYDVNDDNKVLTFPKDKGKVFTPFQQLMFILPPVSKSILPLPFHNLFEKYHMNYPKEFKIDAVVGLKYIYSEAILPEFKYVTNMIHDIKRIERNELTEKDKKRNEIKV